MADEYIDVPIEFDETAIYESGVARIQSYFPNWSPKRGSMIDLVLRTCAGFAAVGAEVASDVPSSIFAAFGELAHEPPIPAQAATVLSHWTMKDNAGYKIDANTPVGLSSAGNPDTIGFWTLDEAVVPAGSTTVDITLVAVEPGSNGSGLDTVVRVDSLGFVINITLPAGPSSGGTDAELTDVFLSRLSQEFETLTDTPVLARDFALLAKKIPPIYRCAYWDNYNPADGTSNNEKMVALSPIDAAGAAVSAPIKTALKNLLESMRLNNFVVNVVDPTYHTVDGAASVHLDGTVASGIVDAALQSAWTGYINPATWGTPQPSGGERPVWINQRVLRLNKVIQQLENVIGVEYAEPVTIGPSGGPLVAADYNLTGAFPLPQAGVLTITHI